MTEPFVLINIKTRKMFALQSKCVNTDTDVVDNALQLSTLDDAKRVIYHFQLGSDYIGGRPSDR